MRHSTIILSFFVLNLLSVQAQDYQTVLSERTYYYSKDNEEIDVLDVDSTQFESDSIFYFSSRIRNFDDCYSPSGPSWFGSKLIIKANGDNCFLNRNEDSIIIRTQGDIGDSWTVYKENSLIIIGEVTDIDTMSFLTLIDSVKTIQFSAFDGNLIPVDHSINNMSIYLSKKYGLIQTLNFSLFPSYSEPVFYNYHEIEMFQLAGLSHPELGIQNLEWNDIYDFQAGDKIHTIEESYYNFPYTKIRTKKTFISRTDAEDSISYIVSIEKIVNRGVVNEVAWNWGPPEFVAPYIDTLTYYADSLLSLMPGDPIIEFWGWDAAWAYKLKKYDEFIVKTKPDIENTIIHFSDPCWETWEGEVNSYGERDYIKGGGGPYYRHYERGENAPYLAESVELVYLKKTDLLWGTPLSFNLNFYSEPAIAVMPNPAQEYILIEIPEQYIPSTIELYDVMGRMVIKENIQASNWRIDLGANIRGQYFYKIMNDRNTLSSGQLVIN